MILAIDFDGVIHDKSTPVPGFKMGRPIEGSRIFLTQLKKDGHTLVIHTLWGSNPNSKKACEAWLEYYHIPFDRVTNNKPTADYYIDDKALKFTNWKETYDAITG